MTTAVEQLTNAVSGQFRIERYRSDGEVARLLDALFLGELPGLTS